MSSTTGLNAENDEHESVTDILPSVETEDDLTALTNEELLDQGWEKVQTITKPLQDELDSKIWAMREEWIQEQRKKRLAESPVIMPQEQLDALQSDRPSTSNNNDGSTQGRTRSGRNWGVTRQPLLLNSRVRGSQGDVVLIGYMGNGNVPVARGRSEESFATHSSRSDSSGQTTPVAGTIVPAEETQQQQVRDVVPDTNQASNVETVSSSDSDSNSSNHTSSSSNNSHGFQEPSLLSRPLILQEARRTYLLLSSLVKSNEYDKQLSVLEKDQKSILDLPAMLIGQRQMDWSYDVDWVMERNKEGKLEEIEKWTVILTMDRGFDKYEPMGPMFLWEEETRALIKGFKEDWKNVDGYPRDTGISENLIRAFGKIRKNRTTLGDETLNDDPSESKATSIPREKMTEGVTMLSEEEEFTPEEWRSKKAKEVTKLPNSEAFTIENSKTKYPAFFQIRFVPDFSYTPLSNQELELPEEWKLLWEREKHKLDNRTFEPVITASEENEGKDVNEDEASEGERGDGERSARKSRERMPEGQEGEEEGGEEEEEGEGEDVGSPYFTDASKRTYDSDSDEDSERTRKRSRDLRSVSVSPDWDGLVNLPDDDFGRCFDGGANSEIASG
ncbi:hypothetical protein TREMEDRAFT_59460 [Tremella mesenterica DSM 1558]|uniref:uncharacterized protein n=1 Tax=Tremella mesenterica (strain ATCC 24925 / CBS 8224 / DSM 1558 / NBRC 9311 / NRRL Y-6157 / RJB 2259-6 / UBC 559-6) TaxID=578456 RepID=UPI0003F49050|nr:uncharacterized protein TREMEDRAFT_59460 [Tremella mesenterica DSM 1558]EIW73295.1 hypothetical protein TREMEDRAFT_59460 [Tremella mesenterica DSM 1558]